jgi:PhzF family phenazine biosynthesis protein
MKLYQVDAFTNQAFSGNPAGVTIVDDFPEEAFMQNVASEMNLSETAFVKKT